MKVISETPDPQALDALLNKLWNEQEAKELEDKLTDLGLQDMKKLIDNPNWAYDLGQKLYETVKDTYDLSKVTRDRAELYKSLIK